MSEIIQLTRQIENASARHLEFDIPVIRTDVRGHFVVFVDKSEGRRHPMLDIFYLVIAFIGFLALWAITKACERV